mmetsp:Transcript_1756/g.2692  ORF Transcript_1756/g.2692 Transcript_1756/m.2692 type:complete len:328 (+) Transcript_1756:196-1179(+)
MAKLGEKPCPDCGGDKFVEDHAQGDIVCRGCGLVVEAHIIDERSEWRTFSDKDKEGQDPNRVGGPNNPLLEGGGLTTMIGKGKDGDGSFALNKLHSRTNNPDAVLQKAFKFMGDLAEKLRLAGQAAKNTANELYKQAHDSGKFKGRTTLSICAACLYVACRRHNTPRSFKEITSFMPTEMAVVRKKDISAAFKLLMALLQEGGHTQHLDQGQQMHHAADYMRRWVGDLKLAFDIKKLCEEVAYRAMPKDGSVIVEHRRWHSRNPMSIAAAILLMVTQIKDPISMQHLATVTNVTEATIRVTYKDMIAHLPELLGPLATEENIAKLRI